MQEGYCSWVCLSVCLLSQISPLEDLFVLKILSRTQRATEVKNCEFFSETSPLQRSSTPPLKAIRTVDHFPAECACVFNHVYVVSGLCGSCCELSFVNCHWSCLQARSVHNARRRGFCTLVHSLSFVAGLRSYPGLQSYTADLSI